MGTSSDKGKKYSDKNIGYIINYLWSKNIKLEKDLNHIQEENINLRNECNNLKEKIYSLQKENNEIREYQQLLNEINILKNENKEIRDNNVILESNILEEIKSIKKAIKSYNNNILFPNNLFNYNNSFIPQNNNNFNNNINQNNYKFPLIFKENSGNGIITLDDCSPSDKISELMERYKEKKGCNDNIYFTYNTKRLEPNNTLEEVKIKNMRTINVMKVKAN